MTRIHSSFWAQFWIHWVHEWTWIYGRSFAPNIEILWVHKEPILPAKEMSTLQSQIPCREDPGKCVRKPDSNTVQLNYSSSGTNLPTTFCSHWYHLLYLELKNYFFIEQPKRLKTVTWDFIYTAWKSWRVNREVLIQLIPQCSPKIWTSEPLALMDVSIQLRDVTKFCKLVVHPGQWQTIKVAQMKLRWPISNNDSYNYLYFKRIQQDNWASRKHRAELSES